MWKNKKGRVIKAVLLAGVSAASTFVQGASGCRAVSISQLAGYLLPIGVLASIFIYSYFSSNKKGIDAKIKEENVDNTKKELGKEKEVSFSSGKGDIYKENTINSGEKEEKPKQEVVIPKGVDGSDFVNENKANITPSFYKYLLPVGLFFGVVFIYCLASGKLSFKKKSNEKILNDNGVEENNFVRKTADEYFEAVFGESEKTFREKLSKKEGFKKDEDGNIVMINSQNGKEYCAGKIKFKNLGSLREDTTKNPKSKKKGRISILGINKMFGQASDKLRDMVDISCLQGNKKNNGAVFLVASNWNTVELLGAWDLVENKKLTGAGQNSYFDDGTQAPPARLGTLPGALACHDLINMDKSPDDPSKWAQTSEGDRQVNLLKDLGIRTVNGYVVDDIENIKKVVEGLEKKDVELENKFNICYHANQQVCAKKVSVGDGAKFADFIYDPTQKVDQVYTAAVSLADFDVSTIAALNIDGWKDYDKLEGEAKEKERTERWNAFNNLKQEEQDEKIKETKKLLSRLAKQIARLNYEAVIRSAIANKKEKVYLTLSGCGAFKNEIDWVINAIENCKEEIENSGLEVIVNISDSGPKTKGLYKKLAPLIYNSKGERVGEFNIFGERDGKIFNVGDNILNDINPKLFNKKIEIHNEILIQENENL